MRQLAQKITVRLKKQSNHRHFDLRKTEACFFAKILAEGGITKMRCKNNTFRTEWAFDPPVIEIKGSESIDPNGQAARLTAGTSDVTDVYIDINLLRKIKK